MHLVNLASDFSVTSAKKTAFVEKRCALWETLLQARIDFPAKA